MSTLINSDNSIGAAASETKSPSKENIFALIFILVFGFILSMPSEYFPLSNRLPYSDLAIYQYIGRLLGEGKGFPYVDAFDHKGPLLYVLYAIGDKINQSHGMWVINYIFVSGTLGFSYFTVRKFLDFKFSSLLCFIIYSDYICVSDEDFIAGTPEFYAGFFISVCIWILADYYKLGDISNKKVLILGLSVGLAFWFKHLTVSTILILCFFIICDCIAHKDYKKIRRYLLLFIVGFAIPSVLVCIWLTLNNAFGAMIEDYFLYNFVYGGNKRKTILNRLSSFRFILDHVSVIAVLISCAVFFIVWRLNSNKESKYSLKLIVHSSIALVITIVLLSLPGNMFHHYAATLFPITALVASCSLEYIQSLNFENLKKPKINKKLMFIIIVLIWILYNVLFYGNAFTSLSFAFLIAYFILRKVPVSIYKNIKKVKVTAIVLSLFAAICTVAVILPKQCKYFWTPIDYETEIVDTINTYANPDDTIIIYGFHSYGVYGASGHSAASKYIYNILVDFSDEKKDEYMAKYRSDIKENRPVAIVFRSIFKTPSYVFGEDILSDYSLVLEAGGEENPYSVYILNERIESK